MAIASSQAVTLPRAFGRYVLFDQIGSGGMAEIYLARMSNSLGGHRLCVIKEIRAAFDDDPAFIELLSAEARLAAKLNHANIVQVFDLGRQAGRLYLAMEYVEGFDLNQLLRRLSQRRIALPAEFAFAIIIETLRGLDYAHRKRDDEGRPLQLVHRDVSPSNVLISFEGEVKLCDFGIAKAAESTSDDDAIAQTRVAGKAGYMAPEHARGEELDARADVFAAGILLWELCAGRRMYSKKNGDVLAQAQRGDVPALPDRGIPGQGDLQAILDKALAPNPADRYATAAKFRDALEDFALRQRLRASALRFGSFLTEHFESEIVDVRRERERAVSRIEADDFGPASAPPPPRSEHAGLDALDSIAENTVQDARVDSIEASILAEVESGALALDSELEEIEAEPEPHAQPEPVQPAGATAALPTPAPVPDEPTLQPVAPPSATPETLPAAPRAPHLSSAPSPEPVATSNGVFYTGLLVASVVLAGIAFLLVRAAL
ncbi:MAG: protein kinase [Myxococcota bacterium]